MLRKQINFTCKAGHQRQVELDFEEKRYRFIHEPEVWHSVDNIIQNGQVSITNETPWCCSRQAYLEYMKELKAQGRSPKS